MKDNPKSDNASPTLCIACASKINNAANICPHCHVDQRNNYRNIKRIVTFFSALSVVLGVITIAISLYPDATRFLFPKEKIDVYALESTYVGKEEVLEMTAINTGNVDLFLNKVARIQLPSATPVS